MIGEKTEKWATKLKLWMYAAKQPISCAELSLVSKLKIMQVEHALKVMRVQGTVDYLVGRNNVRLWYLTKHYTPEQKASAIIEK